MTTRAQRPASGPRHVEQKHRGPLLTVVPALLGFLAATGALLVALETRGPVNMAVAVVGSGAVGVSWQSGRYPSRAARVVLYLSGWVVVGGALWFGADFRDLTLGGVWSLAIAATVGLTRALERAAAGPRDSRSGVA